MFVWYLSVIILFLCRFSLNVPRVVSQIQPLNKQLDQTCGKISTNFDLNCLKSNDSTKKSPQK